MNRICIEPILSLKENEIAVCGSNLSGRHGKGFAKYCAENFQAKYGVGIGRTGQCYMIPTRKIVFIQNKMTLKTLSLNEIKCHVDDFIEYAIYNPDLIFKVSSIGCGYAGYLSNDIAPLFKKCSEYQNIHLPETFWNIIKPSWWNR